MTTTKKTTPKPNAEGVTSIVIEWDGETYELTADEISRTLTPGFLRRNRRADNLDVAYTMLEELNRTDLLDLHDSDWGAAKAVLEPISTYAGKVLNDRLVEAGLT